MKRIESRELLGWIVGVALAAGFAPQLLAAGTAPAAADGHYLLAERPPGAVDVVAARKSAKHGAPLAVVGRVGGRKNPWIKGAAAFSLADRSLIPCNERQGDSCPTPWDYCCETKLAGGMMLVMFVDDAGKPVRQDARQLLGLKELQTVVVVGKAKRDAAGNVTLLATKLFVPEETKTR